MTAPVAELAGCASAAVLVTYGLADASRRLARAVRRLPHALSSLGEGLVYSFAWWLAGGVHGLRHHQAQHCAPAEPAVAAAPPPVPAVLPRTPQPSASEITVFDGRFGELRVRPFLEYEHTWGDHQ
jgi:hypothetical protein